MATKGARGAPAEPVKKTAQGCGKTSLRAGIREHILYGMTCVLELPDDIMLIP